MVRLKTGQTGALPLESLSYSNMSESEDTKSRPSTNQLTNSAKTSLYAEISSSDILAEVGVWKWIRRAIRACIGHRSVMAWKEHTIPCWLVPEVGLVLIFSSVGGMEGRE